MRAILLALLLALCACSIPRSGQRPDADDPVFPHPEGWSSGLAHGASAVDGGGARCTGCHTDQSQEARPCGACHLTWPHPPGWRAGAEHGPPHREGARDTCSTCHGAGDLVAGREHSCTSCHGSYPHAEGWTAGHGAYAVARGEARAPCGSCHGSSDDGDPAGFCGSCHSPWPHDGSYAAPERHGADWKASPGSCTTCHGASGSGSPASAACGRCHSSYPHAAGWSHLKAVEKVGGEGVCMRCHDPGEGPGGVPATCGASCHGEPE